MNSPFGESIPLTHNTLIIILYFFLFLNVFAFRLKKLAFLLESKNKYCTFAAVRAIVSFYEP